MPQAFSGHPSKLRLLLQLHLASFKALVTIHSHVSVRFTRVVCPQLNGSKSEMSFPLSHRRVTHMQLFELTKTKGI